MKRAAPKFRFDRFAFSDTWGVWMIGTGVVVFRTTDQHEAARMARALTEAAAEAFDDS